MFEKETKFITDYILNKIKNIGIGMTIDNLSPKGIHPAILKYISSELDYLIFSERKKLIDNSAFDYSGPVIDRYFNLISEEIKKTKVIGFEDIKKLVVQAVSFNLNFIIRPKWALIKLIFDGKDSVSSDEIGMLLNHIYYYDYLKNIISTYIAKRQLKTLSSIEFELILNKIDKELFSLESRKLIENTLWSLGEFINIGGNTNTKIPLQPIEIFLKEKNQIEILFRLRRAFPIESRQYYEIEEIKQILFSDMQIEKFYFDESENKDSDVDVNETEYELKEEVQEETLSDNVPLEEIEEEKFINKVSSEEIAEESIFENQDKISDEEISNSSDQEVDLNFEEEDILKIYDEELRSLEELEKDLDFDAPVSNETNYVFEEEIEDAEEIEKELLSSDEFAVTSQDGEIAVDSEERLEHIADAVEKASDEKEKSIFKFFRKKEQINKDVRGDIVSFFTEKEINRVISVVFNEDKEDFTTTLEKIAECKTYDEATEIIKSVFLTYRINPYTREAVMLTNAIANYFNQG